MKVQIWRLLAAVSLCGLLSTCCAAESKGSSRPPNLILFLVDDLGYGDLACFGNQTSRTPNIDSLAREGVKLTQLTSAAPICTPSRAAILTGRYPARSGMTSNIPNFRTFFSASQPGGLPLREITLPEKLKEANYSTALIGKWHLGLHSRTLHKAADEPAQNGRHLPLQHGFDYFFGMPVTNVQACGAKTMYMSTLGLVMSQTTGKRVTAGLAIAAATLLLAVYLRWLGRVPGLVLIALCGVVFYLFVMLVSEYTLLNPRSCVLMRDNDIVEQPVRLPGLSQRLVTEAVQFIDKNLENPFFLFFSDVKVHTALFTHPDFAGRSGKGEFVDNVEEMDWTVGALVSALRERGLAEDTVLFFTSDNGPFLEEGHEAGTAGFVLDPRGNRANLKGGKGTIWEGGVRVPGVVHWPGHIAHQVSDQVSSTMDIYSTFVKLAGLPLPADRTIDGRDLSPLLLQPPAPTAPRDEEGRPSVSTVHEYLLYYCGVKVAAVRHGHYKLVMIANEFEIELDTPVGPGDEPHRCVECCPSQVICQCDGRTFDPPLLFDLHEDPGERRPIDPASPIYIREHALAREALLRHANTTARGTDSHPSELEWLPRPWLQPCCDPPACRCCRECSDREDSSHREQWT